MSLKIIDTLTDGTQTYEQRTELDGQEYVLQFQWVERRERWLFGITGVDGTPILTGQTVSLDIPLNRRAVAGPPGIFLAIAESETREPPGLLDLGARVKLHYIAVTDLEDV